MTYLSQAYLNTIIKQFVKSYKNELQIEYRESVDGL